MPSVTPLFLVVAPNRAFTNSTRPGGELLRLLWAIQCFGVVFDALSTRGRRMELWRRRDVAGVLGGWGSRRSPTPSRSSSPVRLLRPAQIVILKSTKVLVL
ncbi:hypothetical protein Taro_054496 [Colocasia esculenta]|uniref:Uncharacterized protein n=1 Tax=Colocasia esculenta TaxID=4460 RepID=A0A843XRB1_COLES|nr:hypothetical protein [Colocasia esculenta]